MILSNDGEPGSSVSQAVTGGNKDALERTWLLSWGGQQIRCIKCVLSPDIFSFLGEFSGLTPAYVEEHVSRCQNFSE